MFRPQGEHDHRARSGSRSGDESASSANTAHEIRRAAKRGFVTKFGPDLVDDFYEVLRESWRELGTPIFTPHYLRAVLKAFPHESVVCVVYDQEGRAAAGAFRSAA